MSKEKGKESNPGEDVADESSSLLQRQGAIAACEVEQRRVDDESRSHNSAVRRGWRAVVNGCTFGNLPRTKRQVIMFALGILTVGVGLYLGLSIMTPSSPSSSTSSDKHEDIRIVLLADAHLIGPQYVCCSESNDVDNDSITKTADRLREAQRQIESLTPRPAAVVFLGDVIHNGYVSHEYKWYLEHENAYTVGGQIFGAFKLPVRYLWGNHDYHTTCGNESLSYDRFELSHRLFRHFLGENARNYSSMMAGPYKLLFLNGMLGPSWNATHPRCDTRLASLGERQLVWLAEELRSGEPAFVFLHHPLPATMRSESPRLPHPDLVSLLLAHGRHIMAVFSGHYHRGLDWQGAYPFPHLTLPSCRYDSDNWFVLQLPKSGDPRSWRLVDWAKNKGGARCSETWDYTDPGSGAEEQKEQGEEEEGGQGGADGSRRWRPRPLDPQPTENGSCGSPTLEQLDAVDLPPLKAADEVPGPTGHQFNPEAPCALKYQSAFLDLCIQARARRAAAAAVVAAAAGCRKATSEAAAATCGGRSHRGTVAAAASDDVARRRAGAFPPRPPPPPPPAPPSNLSRRFRSACSIRNAACSSSIPDSTTGTTAGATTTASSRSGGGAAGAAATTLRRASRFRDSRLRRGGGSRSRPAPPAPALPHDDVSSSSSPESEPKGDIGGRSSSTDSGGVGGGGRRPHGVVGRRRRGGYGSRAGGAEARRRHRRRRGLALRRCHRGG